MIQGFFLVLLKYLEDEKDNIILSNNVCKGVSENLAEVQPLAFSCSFLTMSILTSTDLQLLTYIHDCMEYRQKLVLHFITAFVLV